MIPSTPIYAPTPYRMSSRGHCSAALRLRGAAIMPDMTLVEITYELQTPLTQDQLRLLGEFSNTYGLRRFRFDESKNHLSFEYDARACATRKIAHVLGQATIAVARKVTETGAQPEFKN